MNFADNSTEFFGGVECLTGNKLFHSGADPDHDSGPGIFKGIFSVAG